jgi:hypothetical protein
VAGRPAEVTNTAALKKISIKRLGVNYGHSFALNDENAKNKPEPTGERDKCQIPECYRINRAEFLNLKLTLSSPVMPGGIILFICP